VSNSDRAALAAVVSGHSNGADDAPKRSSNRTLGLVFAAFFALVALLPVLRGHAVRLWALPVAALFVLTALVAPKILTPVNRVWSALGALLHSIVNPIILGVLFYGVFTPFGFLLRRMGKDFLRLKPAPDVPTYWISRQPPGPAPESMLRQF
jgi:Saxitoxin biosynthesis operon protein SxtJ